MIEKMTYTTMIKSIPFFFLETKKASNMVLQGLSDLDIREKAVKENIFQVDSEARKKGIASILLKRIKGLDEFMLQQLTQGNMEIGKMIVIYAIMKTDRLFFEFMNEVFKEKLIVKDYTLEDKDFNIFFDRKKEQSERIAGWDDYTFYKLKQVYLRLLFEAGLIRNQKSREIIKPLLDQAVLSHLTAKGEGVFVNVFLGLV